MTAFFYKDQKSGNQKHPRLIFFQYRVRDRTIKGYEKAQMSLIKCYWILQNARVTAFTFFELLGENQ